MSLIRSIPPLLIVLIALGAMPIAQAAVRDIQVETVSNIWGGPRQVTVDLEQHGLLVSGRLSAAVKTPGRHLSGRIRIELLDPAGHRLAVHSTKPSYPGGSAYSRSGTFSMRIKSLPPRTATVRVSFRR